MRVWVEYELGGPIQVDAELVAETERAAAVRWHAYDKVEHRAWVWMGAVGTRRPPPLAQFLIARRVPIDVAAVILGHTVAVFEAHYLPRAGADRIREHATAIIRAA